MPRILIATAALAACVAFVVINAPHAEAAESSTAVVHHNASGSITLSQHRVVLANTIPSCGVEDQSFPSCTWNVNAGDGNSQGLALWVQPRGHVQYVWTANPTDAVGGRWRWVTSDRRAWVNAEGFIHLDPSCAQRTESDDTTVVRCADGGRYVLNY